MFNLIGKDDPGKLNPMHSDPFKHDCIEHVGFYVRKTYSYAKIDLINGKTKAEHRIDENDFNLLVLKVKAFIDSLPK
jgi:hypothetical protein